MPRRPYLPPGTLREVLAYPQRVESFAPQAFGDALARVGLARLAPMLDRVSRWDRDLSGDEQQNLMLARLLIHRPRWVVVDDLLDAIDDATRARIVDLFSTELEDAAVVYIGRGDATDASFTRLLHIVRDPGDRRMIRPKSAEAMGLSSEMETATANR
jgi:putative ATP-binding cassette transporter